MGVTTPERTHDLLDDEHDRLICYLIEKRRPDSDPYNAPEHQWAMNRETGFIGTYLRVLKAAHRDLNMAGPFDPAEAGHGIPFPIEEGGWVFVPTETNRQYFLNWNPDVALLRALRRLGPMTADEALRRLPFLAGRTPHQLGLRLRSLKRRGPI